MDSAPPVISSELLAALRCPETKQGLRIADTGTIDALNARVARGEVTSRGGEKLEQPVEGGLVTEDGARLYPIRDGFPILLLDEAIDL